MPYNRAPEGTACYRPKKDSAGRESPALILVRAMNAAARSDGRLDAQASQAIFQRIETLGIDPDSQSLLVAEMGHLVDMDQIVNNATVPEMVAEIFIASLLAIDVDITTEQSYAYG